MILFVSTTLLTGMTGISLYMQWSMASQLHDSLLEENNWFFVMDQTPRPPPPPQKKPSTSLNQFTFKNILAPMLLFLIISLTNVAY
jgi:hypothetical protein